MIVEYYVAEETQWMELHLYNMLGYEMRTVPLKGSNGKTKLDVGNFSSGIYIYKITSDKGTLQNGKLMIMR